MPQMVNFEQIGGVDFQKGCYPGQEIVARAQYRGQVKRRMVHASAPAGVALTGQEYNGGMVVNARRRKRQRAPRRHAGLNYYVYYKVDPERLPELRAARRALFRVIERECGVRGRWMRRRDDPTTYMEVYEGVKDTAQFEALLEREGARPRPSQRAHWSASYVPDRSRVAGRIRAFR